MLPYIPSVTDPVPLIFKLLCIQYQVFLKQTISGKTGICLWFIRLDHLTWQTTCECFSMTKMLGFHIGGHWNIWISSTMIANTYNNNFFFHVIQSIRNKIIILTRISLIRHINLILDKYFRQVPTTRKLDYYYYYANIEG